jgi:hypothetical protein
MKLVEFANIAVPLTLQFHIAVGDVFAVLDEFGPGLVAIIVEDHVEAFDPIVDHPFGVFDTFVGLLDVLVHLGEELALCVAFLGQLLDPAVAQLDFPLEPGDFLL